MGGCRGASGGGLGRAGPGRACSITRPHGHPPSPIGTEAGGSTGHSHAGTVSRPTRLAGYRLGSPPGTAPSGPPPPHLSASSPRTPAPPHQPARAAPPGCLPVGVGGGPQGLWGDASAAARAAAWTQERRQTDRRRKLGVGPSTAPWAKRRPPHPPPAPARAPEPGSEAAAAPPALAEALAEADG